MGEILNNEDVWFMPDANEANSKEFYPLQADDYILRISNVKLSLQPPYNNPNATIDQHQLQYIVTFLVYKPKAEDELLDTNGGKAKPLTRWVTKFIDPTKLGFKQDGEPSFLRSIIFYAMNGTDPQAPLKMPGVVVLNPSKRLATEEETEAYKKEFLEVNKGLKPVTEFQLRAKGFSHIPDLKPLIGKYVGGKIGVKTKSNGNIDNVLNSFSKVPSSFNPDPSIEKEAVEKFLTKQKEIADRNASNASVKSTPATSIMNEEINIEDIPF